MSGPGARMKRHAASVAVAGLLTATVFFPFSLALPTEPWAWHLQLFVGLLNVWSWIALPAALILSLFGVRGGPDGMPGFEETAILTFLLWWVALDFGPSAWRWLRRRDRA